MDKNQIFITSGTEYKRMTKELLEKADLQSHIGDRKKKIGIKPNLVSPSEASWGATTHPEVVAGIIEYLKEHGFRDMVMLEGSWVGDKTGEAFETCGFDRLEEEYQVPFWDMQKDKGVSVDCGGMELNVCERVKELDFLITLTSQAGGMGGKTGLYDVGVPIKENTKLGYKLAREGDSIDLGYANFNSRRGRVGHQIAHTLTTGIQQGTLHFVDLSPPPLVTEECRSLNTRQCGIHKYKGECSGVLREEGARAVLTPAKENVRQNGRRMKEPEEPMFTITATDRHGILYHGRIRRLVPRECLRLQGYYDWQIDKIIDSTSDAQLYKQAGNGVTVNVIEAIGRLLQKADSELNTQKVSEKGIH